MYRAEVLGVRSSSGLTTRADQESTDSGYAAHSNVKNRQNDKSEGSEDWKISRTLGELAAMQVKEEQKDVEINASTGEIDGNVITKKLNSENLAKLDEENSKKANEEGNKGTEEISIAVPILLNKEPKLKRVLKELSQKRTDSVSTESSSMDTEAEHQKLNDLGSSSKVLQKATLQKMHAEIERLTLDQRELCRSCFQRIEKQPIPFGLSIMIRLFSNHPQYKNVWSQFKQIPDSSVMHAPELRRHARVYMAGLRLIINSMSDDEKLETALRGIAHAHVKWHIHKYHLINMLPCVIEAFQSKFPMSLDQVEAWTTLFDVIANLIDIFRSH